MLIVTYPRGFGGGKGFPQWGTIGVMRTFRRLSLSTLAALATALVISLPVQAHTQLLGVDPGEGSTVAAGDTVTLTFSSELLDLGAEASVTDATGTVAAAAVDLSQANALIVTIPEVAGGDATLTWRVVAGDGHPIEGTVAFVVETPPAPEPTEPAEPSEAPTASATATPVVTAAGDIATPSPTPSAGDDNANSGVSVAVWVAIAVALAAALFGTTTAARRRAGAGSPEVAEPAKGARRTNDSAENLGTDHTDN